MSTAPREEEASAPQRHVRVLEYLRKHNFADIKGLAAAFDVSVVTVRRDLADLESRGMLRRTHGGALAVDQVATDAPNADRAAANAAAKRRIAAMAMDFIAEGDTVIVDAGTTSLEVAKLLASRSGHTFISNGLDICAALSSSSGNKLFAIGGEYQEVNRSFAGPLAAEAVKHFSADKAILSVASIDLDRGITGLGSPDFACVQQAMIAAARSIIVVADSTKFRRSAISTVVSLDRIHTIVTDRDAPESAEGQLTPYGTCLVRA
jgi:DeoR family transcriptional regulator, repressor of opine catabolism and conjugal transfer